MVQQDGGQIRIRQQILSRHLQRLEQRRERRIGRSEDRERTITAQIISQTSSNHSRLEHRVVWAVHNDVHNRAGLWRLRQQNRIDHVNHAIVRGQIRNGHHRCAIDHNTIGSQVDGEVLAVEGRDHHAIGDVGAHDIAAGRVVQQNGGQIRARQQVLSSHLQRLEQRRERRVSRCKHREWSSSAQIIGQTSSDDSRLQHCVVRAVHNDVDNCCVRRRRRQQHSIDDVHDTIVRSDVRQSHHGRVVDDHTIGSDIDRDVLTIQHGHHHAIGDVTAHDGSGSCVVRQNGLQHRAGQEHLNCDAEALQSCGDRVVRGREDSERTRTIQGCIQSRSHEGRFERVVQHTLCDDVHHRCGVRSWQQNRVDDVNHAVVCSDVCDSYHGCSIDDDTVSCDVDDDLFAVQGGGHHAICEVGAHDIAADDMVEQNGGQIRVRQQVLSRHLQRLEQRRKRRICGRKHGERTCAAQVVRQTSGHNRLLQNRMVWAVNHNFSDCCWLSWLRHSHCGDHACRCVAAHTAIVIINTWDGESGCSDANTTHVAAHSRVRERLRVVPVLTEGAGDAVHVVGATDVDPDDGLACLDFNISRRIHEARSLNDHAFDAARVLRKQRLRENRRQNDRESGQHIEQLFHSSGIRFNDRTSNQPKSTRNVHVTQPFFRVSDFFLFCP